MRLRPFFFAIGIMLAAPAAADFQAGVDAYNVKNFAGAMAEWLPLAEAGDPVAQNAVGALYDHGLGVEENDSEAVVWYRRAAEQNFPLAMRNLGEKYLTGHGVIFDQAQANEWLQKAASLGDPVAAQRLALPTGAPSAAPAVPQQSALFGGDTGTGQTAQQTAQDPSTSTAQQASLQQPNPDVGQLWLLGRWQGPSLGCPPQGGLEFAPNNVRSFYQGEVTSQLPANYRVQGSDIEVSVVGIDRKTQIYRYSQVDDRHFAIASVPESMPQSMIGVRFERCGEAPQGLETAEATPPVAPSVAPSVTSADESATSMTTPDPAESETASADSSDPLAQPEQAPSSATAPEPSVPPAAPEAEAQPQQEAVEPVAVASAAPTAAPAPQAEPSAQVPPAPQNALQAGWRAFGKGDSVGAVALWRPDAEAGNVAMQLLIGSIYDFGQGVPQDDAEAIKWYRMAAAKGSAKGQFLMGAVYARSSQVSDPVKGLAWLKRAERTLSQSGKNADGEVQLTQIQFLAKQVAAGMSADDVAKAGALSSNL